MPKEKENTVKTNIDKKEVDLKEKSTEKDIGTPVIGMGGKIIYAHKDIPGNYI